MLEIFLMRSALAILAVVLGGFGVFCAICSISAPDLSAYAIMCLGSALAIAYFSDRP